MESKHDAFRSGKLQSLAKDILIVEARIGSGAVLPSLLRALLGRHVEARHVARLVDLPMALAAGLPNLIIWRDDANRHDAAAAPATRSSAEHNAIGEIREAGFNGPVVVVVDVVTDGTRLRYLGAVDVIEKDHLDSVRLSMALLKAAGSGS